MTSTRLKKISVLLGMAGAAIGLVAVVDGLPEHWRKWATLAVGIMGVVQMRLPQLWGEAPAATSSEPK